MDINLACEKEVNQFWLPFNHHNKDSPLNDLQTL